MTVRSYHNNLRRCCVLQTLRDSVLLRYSTSPIDDQRVHVNDRDMVYHGRNPQIQQPARPIEDDEVALLRMLYPEPFSDRDPIRSRQALNSRRRPASPESTASDVDIPGDYVPPYQATLRAQLDRHAQSRSQGRGMPQAHNSRGNNIPKVSSNAQPSSSQPVDHPLDDGPRKSDKESEQDDHGNTFGGNPSGGGGPPGSDPSGDPSDNPSDGEPHFSEDDYNRQLRKTPINKTLSPQLPPPIQEKKPGVFGRTRYTSVDPTFNEKETFEYDPTPQSQEEVLRAAFRIFESLIQRLLYGPGSSAPNNAQKTVIRNIPKPRFYYSEADFLVFDDWIRDLVHWLNVANLCGAEVRWSRTTNGYILTAINMFRKNVLVSFLRGEARQWYIDVIESGCGSETNEPITFMQVVSGLYQRFIHESLLSLVSKQYKSVKYSSSKGIKGMFAELTHYAKSMPSPPDIYSFKEKLMLLVPTEMEDKMREIHQVTAESSSVNEIMQAGLACERSYKAGKYYQEAREEMKRAKRRKSRSRSRDRKRKEKKDKHRKYLRSPSPKRLQVVDKQRYSVRAHSPRQNDRPDYPKRVNGPPRNDRDSQRRDYNRQFKPFYCNAWNNKDSGNQGKPRLNKMAESNSKTKAKDSARMAYMADPDSHSDSEHDSGSDSGSESIPDSHSRSPSSSDSESEGINLNGSQYSSDAADEEYTERVGLMLVESSVSERMNAMYSSSEPEDDMDCAYSTIIDEYSPPEEVLNLDFGEYMCSMIDEPNGGQHATLEPKSVPVDAIGTRPNRTGRDNRCLSAFIEINGVRAFVLFDSGSTADAISPDFARVVKLPIFQLENPVTLQLGTKGSRSRISHGCIAKYAFKSPQENVSSKDYFDIANID
ncbi:hypothetical protein PQX77_019162 [Marasmius sp. AFHP31]|nr:hypothetical protein PQX77_019162 [Marasmius sp. AFHP31]